MPEKEVIHTGVDRLVKLVKDKSKVSIKQAAKLLGVDEETIEDWSQFLEEGGLISIEYKFTVPYLVGKKLTREEVEQKTKDIKDEKDIFMRKTESAMNYLDMLDKEVTKIEEVFTHLESHSEKSMRHVQDDIAELERAEKDKERMDKEINSSKESYIGKISAINKKIKDEQEEYEELNKDIRKEVDETARIFETERKEAESIVESEKYLEQKLKEVNELSDSIQKKMDSEGKKVQDSEKKLADLKKRYEDMKAKLDKERQYILKSINDNKFKEMEITKKQEEIIKKMQEKQKDVGEELSELKELPDKFRQFINRKEKIKEILTKVRNEEKGLKEKLEQLSAKGRILKITTGKEQFDKEMKALEKDVDGISSKRNMFEEQLEKLTKLVKV
jgi:chromosome segregation ATPase